MKNVALNKVAKIDRTVATDDDCLTLPYVGLEHVEKESGRFAEGFVPTSLNMLATNFRFTPKHVLYGNCDHVSTSCFAELRWRLYD